MYLPIRELFEKPKNEMNHYKAERFASKQNLGIKEKETA